MSNSINHGALPPSTQANLPAPQKKDRLISQGVGVLFGVSSLAAGSIGGVASGFAAVMAGGGPVGALVGGVVGFYASAKVVGIAGKVTTYVINKIFDGIEWGISSTFKAAVFTVKLPFVATYQLGAGMCKVSQAAYSALFGSQQS